MKNLIIFTLISTFAFSAEIWTELGIKQGEYYYLSGQAGLFCGFLFGFVVLYLVVTK